MPEETDCTQLAAECAALTAVAIVEAAEAATALAVAAAKCQELEDCLNEEEPVEPPEPIPLKSDETAPCKKCSKTRRRKLEKMRLALNKFMIEM